MPIIERFGIIVVTYPDVQVSYVELVEVVYSREQLGQVTNGNTFCEVIVSNDPPNQLSIWHSGGKHTAIIKIYSCCNIPIEISAPVKIIFGQEFFVFCVKNSKPQLWYFRGHMYNVIQK